MARNDKNGRFVGRDFWAYVEKSPACWLWTGSTRPGKWPYGQVRYEGKNQLAHRVAWILTYGPILPGFLVLHHCDTPACVRPDHLFLGTTSDNARDAIKKGRFTFPRHEAGASASNAKLTWEDVRDIRRLYATGTISQARLAATYQLNQSTISHIVRHKTYKD